MLETYKQTVKLNVKKASSILAKITTMLDEDRYCADVAQQCNAVIGLLRKANEMILESHLITCGKKINSSDEAERMKFIKEIVQLSAMSARK